MVDAPPPRTRAAGRREPELARGVGVEQPAAQATPSTSTLRRVGRPSPSNGREPSPPTRRPSSTTVTPGAAIRSPMRLARKRRAAVHGVAREAARELAQQARRDQRIEDHRRLAGRHAARAELAQRALRRLRAHARGRLEPRRADAQRCTRCRAASCRRPSARATRPPASGGRIRSRPGTRRCCRTRSRDRTSRPASRRSWRCADRPRAPPLRPRAPTRSGPRCRTGGRAARTGRGRARRSRSPRRAGPRTDRARSRAPARRRRAATLAITRGREVVRARGRRRQPAAAAVEHAHAEAALARLLHEVDLVARARAPRSSRPR